MCLNWIHILMAALNPYQGVSANLMCSPEQTPASQSAGGCFQKASELRGQKVSRGHLQLSHPEKPSAVCKWVVRTYRTKPIIKKTWDIRNVMQADFLTDFRVQCEPPRSATDCRRLQMSYQRRMWGRWCLSLLGGLETGRFDDMLREQATTTADLKPWGGKAAVKWPLGISHSRQRRKCTLALSQSCSSGVWCQWLGFRTTPSTCWTDRELIVRHI